MKCGNNARRSILSITLLTALLLCITAITALAAPAGPAPQGGPHREGEPHPLPPHLQQPPHYPQYPQYPQPQITPQDAEKRAFDQVGGGVLVKLHYKIDKHGRAKYDIHIHRGESRYKVDVDAMSGQILKYEQKPQKMPKYQVGPVNLSRERAHEIALQRSGGGVVVECRLDYDKKMNRAKYDVEIVRDDIKYDYKIDANSGTIFAFRQENIRKY